MGKQYYCDYCKRSFADGAENRKKHLASLHHQILRNSHYDMFKGPEAILEEAKSKKPCRKFNTTGDCEFGNGCKYSHLTAEDILKLIEQANQEKSGLKVKKPNTNAHIDSWIQNKVLKMDRPSDNVPSCSTKPDLPPVLSSIPNLPPSLIPCKPSELLGTREDARNHWG